MRGAGLSVRRRRFFGAALASFFATRDPAATFAFAFLARGTLPFIENPPLPSWLRVCRAAIFGQGRGLRPRRRSRCFAALTKDGPTRRESAAMKTMTLHAIAIGGPRKSAI